MIHFLKTCVDIYMFYWERAAQYLPRSDLLGCIGESDHTIQLGFSRNAWGVMEGKRHFEHRKETLWWGKMSVQRYNGTTFAHTHTSKEMRQTGRFWPSSVLEQASVEAEIKVKVNVCLTLFVSGSQLMNKVSVHCVCRNAYMQSFYHGCITLLEAL